MTREELIEALEKAEGPGIVFDAEIYCATHDDCERDGRAVILRCSDTGHKKTKFAPPAYTSSIDAALTLVPDGYRWLVHGSRHGGKPGATMGIGKHSFVSEHKFPAIALCIAALKAMEQSDE